LGRAAADFSSANEDLEDMLALLTLLDEHVAVSNTNVHLAAAAARRVRVLVQDPPEWRWLAGGSSCPWYPDFPLYREGRGGGWGEALEALRRDLFHTGRAA
jgi:hypothetical protein